MAALSGGCGPSAREAPPPQQVREALVVALPAHLILHKLEQEPLPARRGIVKINFKANIEIVEDLFAKDHEADDLTLLRLATPAGTRTNFYGQLLAHRVIDQWTLEPPQFQKDFRTLGKPRSAFGQRAYPAGSAEAAAALRQQAAEADKMRQLQQSATEQQERARQERAERQAREELERKAQLEKARLAFEAQRRQEHELHAQTVAQREQAEAAARQKWQAATATGARYRGTRIGKNNSTQRLALVFLEPKDGQLRAEASNPDEPQEKRLFVGTLRFNAQPEAKGEPAYPLVLHGLPSNKVYPEPNSIYERAIDLKLYLAEQGLDGIADAGRGEHFPLHLQRTDNATAK